METTGIYKPQATGTAAENAGTKLSGDLDTFLLMLTTQLQNQDPTSPMDTDKMTQQLVAFSQVEQQIAGNKNLEKLLALQTSSATSDAVGFIGKDIQVPGNTNEMVNGKVTFGYTLPRTPEETTITIFDNGGNPVRFLDGETSSGIRHEFTWDGIDQNGEQAPDGVYSFAVGSFDDDGDPIIADTDVVGTVTGVFSGEDGPNLLIGDIAFPSSFVQRVSAPAKPDAA